jgi:hypothetical protein
MSSVQDSGMDIPPLRLLPLRLRFKSLNLSLKGFSGPLWRSGFGVALDRNFPGVFHLLYAPQARLGRLYALHPPTTPILPGESFVLGLNLFGPATEHALACTQALARLGDLGLGEPRGHFVLEQAWVDGCETAFLDRTRGLSGWPTPMPAAQWLEREAPGERVRIKLLTPLCIKDGNQVVMNAPSFGRLAARLRGRLNQLCEAAGESCPLPQELMERQRLSAEAISLECHELDDKEIKRRSARSGERMKFTGITGSLVYRGDLAPFSGLLALGEVLQVGGRTAFGFGCIRSGHSLED